MATKHIGKILIAPPSSFADLTFDLVSKLAVIAGGLECTRIDRTDPVATSGGELPSILLTHFPSAAVVNAIKSAALIPVLMMDELHHSLDYLVHARAHTLAEGIRALSASAVANLAIGKATNASVVAGPSNRPIGEVIRELALSLELNLSVDDIEAVLAQAAPQGALHQQPNLALHRRKLDSDTWLSTPEGAIASRALAPLRNWATGQLENPVVWTSELFFSGDSPDQPAPKIISVVGPARVIIYGPYLHLPPSEYEVEIILAFTGHIEDIAFSLEVHAGACLARRIIEARPTGRYKAKFHFRHTDPITPIEIRLRNERGAIEGEVALVEMRLYPVPA